MHWRRKWQPTPVFLPGESQGRGAWWAAIYGVTQGQTGLKRLSLAADASKVMLKILQARILKWVAISLKVKSESEVAQACLTLSDPMDCRLPGSSVYGIFQARVLELGAIAFSDVYTTVY